jgi:hypothetical protein
MGKKLGAVFIIYGIINLIASVALIFTFSSVLSIIGLAGIVWPIIFIAIGAWMRRRAITQEHRDTQMDKQTEELERMRKKLEEKDTT